MLGFGGILDEVRVYSWTLSEVEVRQLYALHPVEHAVTDFDAIVVWLQFISF